MSEWERQLFSHLFGAQGASQHLCFLLEKFFKNCPNSLAVFVLKIKDICEAPQATTMTSREKYQYNFEDCHVPYALLYTLCTKLKVKNLTLYSYLFCQALYQNDKFDETQMHNYRMAVTGQKSIRHNQFCTSFFLPRHLQHFN